MNVHAIFRRLAAWLLAMLAAACGAPPGPELREPAGLGDLDRAVRNQYRERRGALDTARGDARASAYGAMGMWYHAYAYWDDAEEAYRAAAVGDPDDFVWPYYRSQVARVQGRLDDARIWLDRVLAASLDASVIVPARVWAGEVALVQTRLDNAESHFRAALASDPSCAMAWYGVGRVALERHAYAQARDAFEAALTRQPKVDAVQYALARALRGLGDADASAALASTLATRNSEQRQLRLDDPLMHQVERLGAGVMLHLSAGRRARNAGAPRQAIGHFQQAIAAGERNAEARIELAQTLAEVGRVRSGLHELRAARARFPDHPRVAYHLGAMLIRVGDFEQGRDQLAASIALDPTHPASRFDLAQVLRRLGNDADAIEHYEAVRRLDPRVIRARLWHAVCLSRLGRDAEALARLDRDLAELPDALELVMMRVRLLAASPDPAVRDGRYAQAEAERLETGVGPRNVSMAMTRGMALAASGKWTAARGAFERALAAVAGSEVAGCNLQLVRERLAAARARRPPRVPWAASEDVCEQPVSAAP